MVDLASIPRNLGGEVFALFTLDTGERGVSLGRWEDGVFYLRYEDGWHVPYTADGRSESGRRNIVACVPRDPSDPIPEDATWGFRP